VKEPIKVISGGLSLTPFVAIGGMSVIVGGFVSAATAFSPSYTASWAVAYLVLVAGIGQIILGLGQEWLALGQPSARIILGEVVLFNAANIAVLAGTLTTSLVLVDLGGGLFLIALALFLWRVRAARTDSKWILYGFRLVIGILIVSTPIGLIIASMRAS
jgi:hypothetical protein